MLTSLLKFFFVYIDIYYPNLLGQEESNSGGMGSLTAYLRCLRKGYELQERGGSLGAVVEKCGRVETSEGHVRRDFGSVKGAASTGIRQAC